MSILIKGMKMPKEDELLCIRIYPSGKVIIDLDLQCKQVAEAVELPDHGDLIDRDALMTRYAEEVRPSNNSDFMRPLRWNDAVQLTELAPVVIPAERSENA